MQTQQQDKVLILTVNIWQILTSTVTSDFWWEQMEAAGVCQKCSIANVNKKSGKKIFIYHVC